MRWLACCIHAAFDQYLRYVAGITAGQAQTFSVPQEWFNAITQFWGAYFERAGAHPGPYDRDLLNFAVKR